MWKFLSFPSFLSRLSDSMKNILSIYSLIFFLFCVGADSLGMLFKKYAKEVMDFSVFCLQRKRPRETEVMRENGLIILLPAIHMWIDWITEWNVRCECQSCVVVCARRPEIPSLPMCLHKKDFPHVHTLYIIIDSGFTHREAFTHIQQSDRERERKREKGFVVSCVCFFFVVVVFSFLFPFSTLTMKNQQNRSFSLARTFTSTRCAYQYGRETFLSGKAFSFFSGLILLTFRKNRKPLCRETQW